MYVIVGLGNPGKQYEETRHNIGFMLIDEIAQEAQVSCAFQSKFNANLSKTKWFNHDVILVKPQTFMNLSGESVRLILAYFKITEQNLIVISDDLDQPHGAVRVRVGGGHGGHNGIRSLLEHMASDKFCRIKIGIGKPLHKSATADWVLHKFSDEEYLQLKKESFVTAKKRILDFIKSVQLR